MSSPPEERNKREPRRIQELLAKNGLVYSEKANLSEVRPGTTYDSTSFVKISPPFVFQSGTQREIFHEMCKLLS